MKIENYWKSNFDNLASSREVHKMSGWINSYYQYKNFSTTLNCIPSKDLDSHILDIGCGPGVFFELLSQRGFYNIFGIDYSLNQIKNKKTDKGYLINADTYFLPIKKSKFDVVVSIGLIQHLSNIDVAIKEMAAVTKKGGRIIIQTLNADSIFKKRFHSSNLTLLSSREISAVLTDNNIMVENVKYIVKLPQHIQFLEHLIEPIPGSSILSHDLIIVGRKM